MKKLSLVIAAVIAFSPFVIGGLVAGSQNQKTYGDRYEEKIYVAIEEEGRVGVIDARSRVMIKSIELSELQNNKFVQYKTHNVQVSPDGKVVLVTANVDRDGMGEEGKNEKVEEVSDGLFDKIFMIDPLSDTIIGSVPLDVDIHVAHIVVDNKSEFAYTVSQEKGIFYIIDLLSKKITKTLSLGDGSEPHGMRLSPDNSKAYVALIGGRAIAEINLSNYTIEKYPLSGATIQTAVTADGKYVFGSVYDAKKIAWINILTDEQGYIDLPEDAKGSVQLYATPDSKYLYAVNQGYYFEQPTGNAVYRIDIGTKKVDRTIPAGDAPHGVVVDKDGLFVYVTNLLSKDLSVIDTSTNKEVARVKVGEMPNGVSVWNKKSGGTP